MLVQQSRRSVLRHHSWSKNIMTSRFEIWNNVHRAMTPLAHWYTILDNDVILDIQNKVIHEILHDRTCLIKWAPMHEQVTMLQKLLSHNFEQYADVQDDGYISDKDIEEYPETFMPRPCTMPTNIQGPVQPQQPEVAQIQPHCNTEQGLHQIRRVLFPSESSQKMNQCHWMASTSTTKVCTSRTTLQNGSTNHHQTDTYASTTNTRTDVNISEHHPIRTPQ